MWWADAELPGEEQYVRHLPFGEVLRRVGPLFRPHMRLLLAGIALMLVSVAADLAGPLVLRALIDDHIAGGSRSGILQSALYYAVLYLVVTGATFVQVLALTKVGLAIVTALKESLFSHLLTLSLAYFDKNPPGKLLARVESDAERLQMLFSEVGVAVLRTFILVAGTVGVMLAADWKVTLILLGFATPLAVGTVYYFRWMRGLFRRVRELYARISAFVTEYVQGVPILQIFGYEKKAMRRLARLNDDRVTADRNASMLEYGFWGFLTSMEVIAVILIIYAGSGPVFGKAMTTGTLILFIELTRRIFWPLAIFSEQMSFIQRALASADRVFGVLDTPSLTPDRAGARERVPDDWQEVAFDEVTFEYEGGTKALDKVSFRVRRGEKVALVGLSGGGKTTTTSLLLRYYEPTEGRITLDGIDIRDFLQRKWREKIGLVLQDIHLFPGTVGDNLRSLVDEIPEANLERAVSIVGAGDLIERLPKKYGETLTEGGTNLSMGERQLLSFARAIVRDPDLLILDEATSSVDPATERRLQVSMDRLLRGRTSLIIAHRLATIVSADRILVLHRGKLAEEGSHTELYEQGGIYRDLFDLQFQSGVTA
ncbi:MAG: ABC transporter ATP-binding protein [Planctomycetota bacterium]|jgi:ABC-type multidrug transport system fused ATPase/permease subunit